MKIPVLTYHSLHAPGWQYQSNDHLALESDLHTIRRMGFLVLPLVKIAQRVRDGLGFDDLPPVVGISFDDGTDHDFYDFSHPDYGHLKSMARILRESAFDLAYGGGQANATSFVIASPQARSVLDQSCIAGRSQWRDCWWYEANKSGVISIANHSWDHLHASLEQVDHSSNSRGSFDVIHSLRDADAQIAQAQTYLNSVLRENSVQLFAYPYGQSSDYLTNHYLPVQTSVQAAFRTGGEYIDAQTSLWSIPRFVCQEHWKNSGQLGDILSGAIS